MNEIAVEAINGTELINLTPSLAVQCGYSMESDPWGNARIYTSLMGCYVDNKEDTTFNIGFRLHVYSPTSGNSTHEVKKTCIYSRWASQEILCDRNYMEVSNYVGSLNVKTDSKGQDQDYAKTSVTGHGIWKMTFFTPEPVVMMPREIKQAGYGATVTPNRIVIRTPYDTAETYSEDVAAVPMQIFKVAVYHTGPGGLNIFNLVAACPTGGIIFTEDVISWHIPLRVAPLLTGGIKIMEKHMGINGQRLDNNQMTSRGYKLTTTDYHIIVEIPVGSPDGYYKSHALDNSYYISYTVEPMVEVLWRADDSRADTRYKILFPITTPLMPHQPVISDNTIPEDRIFSVVLGPFLPDVMLRNITFSTETLSIEECSARGFLVQEHKAINGSKLFSLQVPFDDKIITTLNPEPLVTVYTLSLVFGFVIMPEESLFSYAADFEQLLQDVVLPTISGTCDENNFYISVKYGSQGHSFQSVIGAQQLTPELAEAYNVHENGTHFHLTVPYVSQDAVFELVNSDSVRARINLILYSSSNNWKLNDYYMSCNFPLAAVECYPNGTITATAVKVESVPNLTPSLLTLKDKNCKPAFSDDQFAHFTFTADSCGTTRTFFSNYMLYENEIMLPYHKGAVGAGPVYRQSVSCYYMINETDTVLFKHKPSITEPAAEIGSGHLMVHMRLAQDESYKTFYRPEDYPVVKYLRQPLYFEVELQVPDNHLELFLENCWATVQENRTSLPSWDIIVDGCVNKDDASATMFHPVASHATSFPQHIKRFSVKMFTFVKDDDVLKDEIYVHCDAVVCDDKNRHVDAACKGQCVNPTGKSNAKLQAVKVKREPRSASSTSQKVSSGQILLK
ncbi:zona pellucida protein AX 1 [Thalassophryne amazonica]|uniref:zona pellucida protein AX 1 n=1 Tax=Thalassophryne amazonica TaxID=390379 RepID=UPI00147213D5|nr:zona pellucida protein AX 1 [Thalassophryne amazonica]